MRTLLAVMIGVGSLACTSMPEVHHKSYTFPKDKAFVGDVKRPYEKLGMVRAEVNFQSLDFSREEDDLCRNYYNKAVRDLVKLAEEKGAQAVIDVKSIVFYQDFRSQVYSTPECSDDGGEGQALVQGVAVVWKDSKASGDSK